MYTATKQTLDMLKANAWKFAVAGLVLGGFIPIMYGCHLADFSNERSSEPSTPSEPARMLAGGVQVTTYVVTVGKWTVMQPTQGGCATVKSANPADKVFNVQHRFSSGPHAGQWKYPEFYPPTPASAFRAQSNHGKFQTLLLYEWPPEPNGTCRDRTPLRP